MDSDSNLKVRERRKGVRHVKGKGRKNQNGLERDVLKGLCREERGRGTYEAGEEGSKAGL